MLITSPMLPSESMSLMFGCTLDEGLASASTATSRSAKCLAVPSVPYSLKPMLLSVWAYGARLSLASSGPTANRMPLSLGGNLRPADMTESRYASCMSWPKHATSPVDAISTPSVGSAPCRRLKLNRLLLTQQKSRSRSLMLAGCTGRPTIARVASSIKLVWNVLLTNGNERDARRLHSITLTSFDLEMNWMLNGPVILSAAAMLPAIRFTRRCVSV
mmetsp:Transcript_6234/g.17390  ORF Transcript_6234/g.17390 Transcript_6234/m.17390 type:complete len:217 (-) Transcript_6234:612-1262(-)